MPAVGAGAAVGASAPAPITPTAPTTTAVRPTSLHSDDAEELTHVAPAPHTVEAESTSPISPTSPTSLTSPTSPTSATKTDSKGIKSFLNKFKRRSKHSSASADAEKPGFIGGVALRESESNSHSHPASRSTPSSPVLAPDTTSAAQATETSVTHRRYSDISSISSDEVEEGARGRTPERTGTGVSGVSDNSEFEEAKDGFDEGLAPPVSFATDGDAGRRGSPNRDSKFREVGI